MSCDETAKVIGSGVTFGATRQDAEGDADSASQACEGRKPCPSPCDSWFRLSKATKRITQRDLEAYRQLFGIPEDAELIFPPKFKCIWELLRKCEDPPQPSVKEKQF